MSNQASTQSLIEDKINKPWRPIPSSRITIRQARALRWILVILSLSFSAYHGNLVVAAIFLLADFAYNDIGCSAWWFTKSLLNAVGYSSFQYCAVAVACGNVPCIGCPCSYFGEDDHSLSVEWTRGPSNDTSSRYLLSPYFHHSPCTRLLRCRGRQGKRKRDSSDIVSQVISPGHSCCHYCMVNNAAYPVGYNLYSLDGLPPAGDFRRWKVRGPQRSKI